jgi:hypothetical protein
LRSYSQKIFEKEFLYMHPKRSLLLVALILSILAWSAIAPRPVYAASVRYAVPDGSTTGDCLSWATACTLQHALASAVSGDQIWVKMGTYTPGTAGERTATFTLKNGVTLYGGFPTGTTESRLMDRSYISYPTILSGDLNGNGIDHNDAYRVVTASHTDSSAVLDGFTITGGNANGDATQRSGSGIYIDTGSPTLRNLVISANETDGIGAGVYLYQSSPILDHVTFSNNLARMYGGAMYAYLSSLSLTNVIFDNNTVNGGDGGALYLYGGSATLSNVSFRGNIAIPVGAGTGTQAGGSGGALYVTGSDPILNNVIFSQNVAGGNGGALDLENSNPILSNVTFSGNGDISTLSGRAIYMNNSSPQIRNSIIWGDGTLVTAIFGSDPVYTRVILRGGGAGTLDADPLFEFAGAHNLNLRPASPAINYGDNTVTAPGLPATDRNGYPRIADGTVDLGAYENQGPYNNAPVLSGSMSDLALLEDPVSNPGHKVSDLLAGHVSDADGTAAGAGMVIYAVDNTNGDWQFSNDGGTTWTALGVVYGISSTLLGPDAFVRFTPTTDWSGPTTLSFRAWDIPPDLRTSGTLNVNSDVNGGRTSFSAATGTITLVVTPVNDAPSFTGGADQVVLKDGAAQTVSAWATDISAGPSDEAGQALNFIADNDNHALFSTQPAISVDGTLTYTPAAGAIGSATVSVSLHDDGGTADGGVDTSAVQTFTIVVTPAKVFVKANATGAGNGTSWTDAYTSLQTALARTTAGCEIWVAAATYKPGAAGNNDAAFTLKEGVAIYGGFAGTEDDRDARNWKIHPTILSGDLNGDATHDDNDAYHVVMASAVSNATVLDGFTITGGNALGGEHEIATGGGMALSSSSLTLSNLIFSDNAATMGGGMALYNSSSPTLNNVAFHGNHAIVTGGGMDLNDNSSPILNNVVFHGNHTDSYGGGMALTSSNPILNNVIFSGNHADEMGGGMVLVSSDPILSNVTFSGNNAVISGGGILLAGSKPQVRNSILWGNTAGSGAQVENYLNSSAPVYTWVLIQGGGGTLDADPQFVDADGPDGVSGTPDDNLRLNFGSPAIDVGDNFACPFIDLDGLSRPGDGNADGTATCDLGAYEAGEMLCAAPYNFTKQSGVSIQVDTPGNLACLYVDEMGSDHAHATSGIQTGRYWLIRGLQNDKISPASGFSLTLTLPVSMTPDSKDKVCRYTGSAQTWDCGLTDFDAGAKTITRSGITALSDWAVGNDVATAVLLVSLDARAETSVPVVVILLVAMFGGAIGAARRK